MSAEGEVDFVSSRLDYAGFWVSKMYVFSLRSHLSIISEFSCMFARGKTWMCIFHPALIRCQYKVSWMINLSKKICELLCTVKAEVMFASTLCSLPTAKMPHYFLGPWSHQSLCSICEPQDGLCRCDLLCPPGSRPHEDDPRDNCPQH